MVCKCGAARLASCSCPPTTPESRSQRREIVRSPVRGAGARRSPSEHPYVKTIVREGFVKFADIHIGCFANATEVPVHFVGSVGAIFHEILKEVLEERGFRLGQNMRKPVDGLIKYHLKILNILNAYQV